MNRLYIVGAAGLVLLTGGCASDQASSRADSAVMLSTTGHADPAASRLSNQGQIASVWGDTHTSTLLFEQAVAADPSPLNKFNLAGAYQNEGRQGSALLLYDQVAKEGKASEATTLSPADHRDQRNVRFNLAAAAQDRAAITLGRLSLAPTAATGEATNVSTGPSAPIGAGMSPSEAAALDALENPL